MGVDIFTTKIVYSQHIVRYIFVLYNSILQKLLEIYATHKYLTYTPKPSCHNLPTMDPHSFSSSAAMAQQTWELENSIVTMEPSQSPNSDSIFHYNESAQAKFQQEKPWTNDPHYFKRVKVSALALLKMVVHARSGGTIEVMGLMQGKTDGDAIIVMDAFALPVEGTETRVNAQADAYEYMVEYSQTNKQVDF